MIESTATDDVWHFLSYQYTRNKAPEPTEIHQGTFLTYDAWQAWWAEDDSDDEENEDEDEDTDESDG